jgi:ribosomal protein L3
MSRFFTADGKSIPVTLIEATPNRITQIKTVETDGYSAVQVTAGVKRASLLSKPEAGHLAKAKVEAVRGCGSCASKPTRSVVSKVAARSRPTFSKPARSSTSRA